MFIKRLVDCWVDLFRRQPTPLPNQQIELTEAVFAHGPWVGASLCVGGSLHEPPNQDCTGVRWCPTHQRLHLAVADGVTNGALGHVAAKAAVDHWLTLPHASTSAALTHDGLMPDLYSADEVVAQVLAEQTPELGAAVGAAVWAQADPVTKDMQVWATRVGDCRVLLLHFTEEGWHMEPVFADQTLSLPNGDQPAHFVGVGRLGTPELKPLDLPADAVLVLCSDGIHATLTDEDWQTAFSQQFSERDTPITSDGLLRVAHTLLTTARTQNPDDASVLLVRHTSRHVAAT